MTAPIKVTKRSGKTAELDIERIHKVVEWACEGITGVSISDIVLSAKLKFYNRIPTREIHSSLIDTAEELTTVDTPNYDKVAARLYGFDLRKRVYGSFEAPERYSKLFTSLIKKGLYTKEFGDIPKAFIDRLWDKHVKQDNEYEIPCYGLKQLEKKYCVTSRTTGKVHETPSMVYFRAALVGAMQRHVKMDYMSEEYLNAVEKTFKVYLDQFANDAENSLPSPIMNGVGTPLRQYSSCTGIDVGDSIPSINAGSASIVTYVTQRAGIGANVGRIRAIGEDVRGGEVRHTGLVPFIKKLQGDVHCVSQGGYRKSAATMFFPIWHFEFPELVVLKDNTLVEETTARHLDYGITINGYFYEKLLRGEDITLISPHHENHRLYEAFALGKDEFAEVYEEMIANPKYRTRRYSAAEIFTQMFLMQRKETGRIYFVNIDHANAHGAFDPTKAPVHFSNLCVAPETLILTDQGYQVISELEGQEVAVWNGEEFSKTTVQKTGENQKLITVKTDSGQELTCTEYHKFYLKDGRKKKPKEVRAAELKEGDILIPFELPLIEGHEMVEAPFEKGRSLTDVPTVRASKEDRIDWLNGAFVEAGEIVEGDAHYAMSREVATEVQLMIQTLGIHSRLTESGLMIEEREFKELVDLSANPKTGSNAKALTPVKVTEVVDNGRTDDTYCFTEEKRHMGMFNGLLTGQCLEILLPASPMQFFNDPSGEIFLCTLANINMGTVKIEDLQRVCYNTVRYLDDLLDYQDYPTESARYWATKRRALGIGINNYAYWLARQGLKYGEKEALEKTHEYMEAMQYWLIDASAEIAKEKGRCELFDDTKYSQGILPCDAGSYKEDVDTLGDFELKMDWEALRAKVKEHGMRNSTLSAIPPSETSSQVIKHGATNSVEQARALITRRSNKDISGKTMVPELTRLKNKYDLLWDHASPEGYLFTIAVIQKWVDQSISANFSYNPRLWENGDIPMSQMVRDLLIAYKYGLKTGYYHNTNKESGISEEEAQESPDDAMGCEGGGCDV